MKQRRAIGAALSISPEHMAFIKGGPPAVSGAGRTPGRSYGDRESPNANRPRGDLERRWRNRAGCRTSRFSHCQAKSYS
jgi:hypothetical protein